MAKSGKVLAMSDTRLRDFMNIQAFDSMPQQPPGSLDTVREAGYEGVQLI
jgi:hypothetical protein